MLCRSSCCTAHRACLAFSCLKSEVLLRGAATNDEAKEVCNVMSDDERPISGDDEEHLAKIIVDSIREAEKLREDEGPPGPEAFRALDKAELAAEELNHRIWRLRGELDTIGAPLTFDVLKLRVQVPE